MLLIAINDAVELAGVDPGEGGQRGAIDPPSRNIVYVCQLNCVCHENLIQ